MDWDPKLERFNMQGKFDGVADDKQLESFRIEYLGRKGRSAQLYSSLASLPNEKKPALGKAINDLKSEIDRQYDANELHAPAG